MDEMQPTPGEPSPNAGRAALDRAIACAKKQTASSSSVELVTRHARALENRLLVTRSNHDQRGDRHPLMRAWPWALAGAIGFVVIYASQFALKPSGGGDLPSTSGNVRYSAIKQVVLTQTSLRPIEDQLSQAEQRLKSTSEAVQLMSIRQQALTLLEQSNDWRKK